MSEGFFNKGLPAYAELGIVGNVQLVDFQSQVVFLSFTFHDSAFTYIAIFSNGDEHSLFSVT
jgi:hypothetical protein